MRALVRGRRGTRRRPSKTRTPNRQARIWLEESERLYRDFVALTPYRVKPFVRSFDSFAEYERWRRAQTNPWYR